MSDRSGIAKAYAAAISTALNGAGDYVNNVYGNVTNKIVMFDDVNDYPFISVTPGPEERDDLPSRFTWATLTLHIRIFVEDEEDAQGKLESLITDVETFVDTNLQLQYSVVTPQGPATRKTTTNSITSIVTDEGLLTPYALGEVTLSVKYEKIRKGPA